MAIVGRRLVALIVVAGVASPAASAAPGESGHAVSFPANCRDERVKPRAIVVTCADANFRIVRIAWEAWTRTAASGSGTAKINDCDPNCVAGRFRSYPAVTVRLSHPVTCTATGVRQFTRLRYVFARRRPNDLPRTGRQLYRCPTRGG